MSMREIPEIQLVGVPKAKKSRGTLWVTLFIALVLGGTLFITLWTRDGQSAPPRMLGSVCTAKVADQPRLFYVMEEERWQRRIPSYARRMYWFTVSYSLFTLHARDAHSGVDAGRTELARIDFAPSGQGPEILGPQGDILWLWNAGLEGRKTDTLELVWSEAKLAEVNPDVASLFPDERKYCKVIGQLNGLVFKGKDARYFQADSATGRIQPLDDAKLGALFHTGRADDGFTYNFSGADSLWSTSVGGLMWNSLTSGDMWYALMSNDERAKLVGSPGSGNAPWGESSRQLYRGKFEWEYRQVLGTNEVKLDLDTVAPVNGERFLMAGFLRRPNTTKLWTVDDGKSFLVLHRKEIGADSPWHITRLGLDGTIHWTCSTGLADPMHLCDGLGSLVFTGFAASSQPTRKRPDLFVFVNEQTGEARTLNLVSNEFKAASSN